MWTSRNKTERVLKSCTSDSTRHCLNAAVRCDVLALPLIGLRDQAANGVGQNCLLISACRPGAASSDAAPKDRSRDLHLRDLGRSTIRKAGRVRSCPTASFVRAARANPKSKSRLSGRSRSIAKDPQKSPYFSRGPNARHAFITDQPGMALIASSRSGYFSRSK